MSTRISSMVLALAALAAPAAAQAALQQPFHSIYTLTFPPTDWANLPTGTGATVWQEAVQTGTTGLSTLTSNAAVHVPSTAGTTYDSRLVTPLLDLSGLTAPKLSFDHEIVGAVRMAHHPNSVANGLARVDFSTNGGTTWTPAWEFDGLSDGTFNEFVDLAPLAGLTGVRLSFRYFGENAHVWAVDNVVLHEGATPAPAFGLVGTLAGGSPVIIQAGRMAPSSSVVFMFSNNGPGPFSAPSLGTLSITPPFFISPPMPVSGSGAFAFTTLVPNALSGATLFAHAIEVESSGTLIPSGGFAAEVQ